jgi:hypothetical protein
MYFVLIYFTIKLESFYLSSSYALRGILDAGKEKGGDLSCKVTAEVHLTVLFVSRKDCNRLPIDASS